MLVLSEFIFRLSFGFAAAMAMTSPRQVSSGYYRNNSYVLLGLNALLAALAWMGAGSGISPWPPTGAAALAYFGAALWLYEKPRAGLVALVAVAGLCFYGAATLAEPPTDASPLARATHWLEPVAGGWLLGTVFAAMLLGHWHLNAPGMSLAPLKRLVACIGGAVLLRAAISGLALAAQFDAEAPTILSRAFLALHWLAGICGTGGAAWMAWQTLKIPNTQSATGILYVGVMFTFVGELTAQLLSNAGGFRL